MTLGSIAELKVKDYKVLDNVILHMIPSGLMKARIQVEKEYYAVGGK